MNGQALLAGLAAALAVAQAAACADPLIDRVRDYRIVHQQEILTEFTTLLAEPNDASDVASIERNAATLKQMLERRGLASRILSAAPGTPPSVYGEMRVPGARRTILFYAHYDGQPVAQPDWWSPPFEPVIRAGADRSAPLVDWKKGTSLDDDMRVFARSSGDDKGTVIALLAALDALRSAGRRPTVNVKILFEGEEEKGSPHLASILRSNRALLKADLMILGDGPINPTGLPQVVFGARGFTSVELTAYGPARPLHDGHYGNWAPNPTVMLARLIADVRDEDGHINIPGFGEDVRPLSDDERRAYEMEPPVEDGLKKELALGRTELDPRLPIAISRPALNVRGFAGGSVGASAANAIPSKAAASIDFRLVPDQRPDRVRQKFEDFARSRGWFVTSSEPGRDILISHPKVLKLEWQEGYQAYRADMASPAARAVLRAVMRGSSSAAVSVPLLGGSVPMATFSDELGIPIIGVPIANHDDNQHAANENLRLGNLWAGIEIYASLLTIGSW